LLAMSEALFEVVLARHARRRRKVRRITVDLDVTDDPTHGAQQLAFFNGFYDSWCYLPLQAFLTFDREREQFLCAAALRPGNAPTQAGALTLLKRIIGRLQERLPKARILVRLDGGFAAPELFEFLDAVGVDYVVAMAKNKVLERLRHALTSRWPMVRHHDFLDLGAEMITVRQRSWHRVEGMVLRREYAGRRFFAIPNNDIYGAIRLNLEGREPRLNARFVVTNLPGKAQRIYERIYCMRGETENRIKELFDVAIDRTSCTRFLANQLRVLLAAAAYVLLQELRLAARGTAWARAQVATLRLDLLKIGVQVIASVRRLVLRLPAAFPYRDGWRAIALRCGATPG